MARIAGTFLSVFLGLVSAGPAGALELTPAAWDTGDWIDVALTGSPIAAPDSIGLEGPGGELIQADLITPAADVITFRVDLRHAALGWYDLRLATLAGDAYTEADCFEVRPLALPEAWSAAQRLTDEPETSDRPKIAVDRFGQVHLVWQNQQAGTSDHFNILYRRWTGSAWTEPEFVTSGG